MSRRLNRRQTYEPPSSCRTVARHLISLHRSAPPRGAGGRRAERLLEADCVLVWSRRQRCCIAAYSSSAATSRTRWTRPTPPPVAVARTCLGRRLTEVRSGVFDEG